MDIFSIQNIKKYTLAYIIATFFVVYIFNIPTLITNAVNLVNEYGAFMASSNIPKLFINADPGSILIGSQREFCRSWPNQEEVTVKGLHFIQEDSPLEIADAIEKWIHTEGI